MYLCFGTSYVLILLFNVVKVSSTNPKTAAKPKCIQCEGNLSYSSLCKSSCPPRCSVDPDEEVCVKKCMGTGCECKDPYALTDDGRCILRRHCPVGGIVVVSTTHKPTTTPTKETTTIEKTTVPITTPIRTTMVPSTKKPVCKGNEEALRCSKSCEGTCNNKKPSCSCDCDLPYICLCKYPFVRDSKGKCIYYKKCKKTTKPSTKKSTPKPSTKKTTTKSTTERTNPPTTTTTTTKKTTTTSKKTQKVTSKPKPTTSSIKCSSLKVAKKCDEKCERRCNNLRPTCKCNSKMPLKCFCKSGYVLNQKGDKCISQKSCPFYKTTIPTTATSKPITTTKKRVTTTKKTTTTTETKKPTTTKKTTTTTETKKPTTTKEVTTTTRKPTMKPKTTTIETPTKKCPKNMKFSECPRCQKQCLCEDDCLDCNNEECGEPKCICKNGYILHNGSCISEEKCEKLKEEQNESSDYI